MSYSLPKNKEVFLNFTETEAGRIDFAAKCVKINKVWLLQFKGDVFYAISDIKRNV